MNALDIGSGYVPDFIRNEVLAHLPTRSGEGIHRALYDLARVLTPYRTVAEREAIVRRYWNGGTKAREAAPVQEKPVPPPGCWRGNKIEA
jgi:hypothetical protein